MKQTSTISASLPVLISAFASDNRDATAGSLIIPESAPTICGLPESQEFLAAEAKRNQPPPAPPQTGLSRGIMVRDFKRMAKIRTRNDLRPAALSESLMAAAAAKRARKKGEAV